MMIRGVIFDLDGTLVRLPIRYDLLQSELKKMFNTTQDFIPLISDIVSRTKNDHVKIKDAFNIICNEEQIAAEQLSVVDGAQDILRYFKSKNFSLGLVTMQCKKAADIVLEKINVANVFSSVITRDESHDRYEQIRKSLEKLNLNPDEVLMVGDRIHDAKSAKKAGCMAVLINKDMQSCQEAKVITELLDLKNFDSNLNVNNR